MYETCRFPGAAHSSGIISSHNDHYVHWYWALQFFSVSAHSSTSVCVAILPLYCSIKLFSCLAYFTVFACTYIVMIYLKWLSSFLLPCYVFMWQWPWPSVFLARISSWWRGSELVIYDLDITSFVLPCAAQRALICVDRTSYWGTQSSTLVSCFSQVESEKMEEDV